MKKIPNVILNKTARQRYALMKSFMKYPDKWFTRKEIMNEMRVDPYKSILTMNGRELDGNPLCPEGNQKTVPTVLIDRLRELVKENAIESVKQGKEVTYKLKRNFGADPFEEYKVSVSDSPLILQIGASLEKYSELPYGDLLEDLDNKSKTIFTNEKGNEDVFTIVDFETPFVKDMDLRSRITELHWTISDRLVISSIKYKGNFYPGKKPKTIQLKNFMPYLLKESRGQWYLVGKCQGDVDFRIIPVNRIIGKINYSDAEFEREPFKPEAYWDGCVGITRQGSPITVMFKARNGRIYNNIDYIRLVPIVKGHQEMKRVEAEWAEVTLKKIYFGPELVRVIRSFGRDNIRDVRPVWLEEDLWETGRKGNVEIQVAFSNNEEVDYWKRTAIDGLNEESNEEDSDMDISIIKSKLREGWYNVTLKNVRIYSGLYFLIDNLLREFGDDRVRIRDRSFLR